MFQKTVFVEGHEVTLEVSDYSYVSLNVDGRYDRIDAELTVRLKIALAARRLWQEALYALPLGVYVCEPACEKRRELYIAAGWRPCRQRRGDLEFRLLTRSRRAAK